jgi:hypothetical protein
VNYRSYQKIRSEALMMTRRNDDDAERFFRGPAAASGEAAGGDAATAGAHPLSAVEQAQAALEQAAALLRALTFTKAIATRRRLFQDVLGEAIGAQVAREPIVLKSALMSSGNMLRDLWDNSDTARGRRETFMQVRSAIDLALLRINALTDLHHAPARAGPPTHPDGLP